MRLLLLYILFLLFMWVDTLLEIRTQIAEMSQSIYQLLIMTLAQDFLSVKLKVATLLQHNYTCSHLSSRKIGL